jgi:hypothetical protein
MVRQSVRSNALQEFDFWQKVDGATASVEWVGGNSGANIRLMGGDLALKIHRVSQALDSFGYLMVC